MFTKQITKQITKLVTEQVSKLLTNQVMSRRWLWVAGLCISGVAGACTSVLDFTECTTDEDCALYFDDMKPMRCNDTENRCVVKQNGCSQNSECKPLGEDYICGLSSRCFKFESEYCDDPKYPGSGDDVDDVLFVGSLVDRRGDGEAREQGIALAIEEFNANASVQLGGNKRREIAWVACNTEGDAQSARRAAKFLAGSADSDEGVGVAAMIGPFEDDVFTSVVEQVSLAKGVLAFTVSPTAIVDRHAEQDAFSVVWRATPGATRHGEALLDRMNDLDTKTVLTILAEGDRAAEDLFGALTEIRQINGNDAAWVRIDNEGAQVVIAYVGEGGIPGAVAAAVDAEATLDGKPDVMLVLGGPETGKVLEAYHEAAGGVWPSTVILSPRGVEGLTTSLAAINSPDANAAIEIVGAQVPNTNTYDAFAARFEARFGSPPMDEAAQAYDATMMALFAISGVGSRAILGPTLADVVIEQLTGSSPVASAGDPTSFDEVASTLGDGGDAALEGAASGLAIDVDRREVCSNLVGYEVASGGSAPELTVARTYQVTCPNLAGTWK